MRFLFLLIGFIFSNSAFGADQTTDALNMQQVVQEALHSNLDLLAAKYGVPMAEADELSAGLWNNPSLLFDTQFQPLHGGNWNQTSVGGPKQYDLILSYPLDLSGKRSSAEKSAHTGVSIAKASLADAVRLKVLDTRLAYIEVIDEEYQLTLLKEKEASLDHLVTVTENRVGHASRMPLLLMRAQLAFDQAKLDTRQKEISLRAALVQLASLLGRNPSDPKIDLQHNLRDFQLLEVANKETLMQEALDTRPDLQALQLSVDKAELDKDLAHAQIWDNFSISAGASRQGSTGANPNDPNSNAQAGAFSWNAGITMPLPFLNHNQGNIEKALYTKEQTQKQLAAKELSIRQEIDGLVDQINLGRSLIEDYEKKQLKRAREVRDAQQRIFGTGNSALLDYLDALSAYQNTLSSYYDTVAEYRRNLARLNASVGKDFL